MSGQGKIMRIVCFCTPPSSLERYAERPYVVKDRTRILRDRTDAGAEKLI